MKSTLEIVQLSQLTYIYTRHHMNDRLEDDKISTKLASLKSINSHTYYNEMHTITFNFRICTTKSHDKSYRDSY